MEILHVVTLISPDGAYGGPTRVATNLALELDSMGHDVTVAAASRGYSELPQKVGNVSLRLFPAVTAVPRTGFAGITSPGLLKWAATHLRQFDVVHVHLARDLVTLPIARMANHLGVPLVTQTHGMIAPSHRLSAKPLDAAGTRPALRNSAATLHLTSREKRDLLSVAGPALRLHQFENGVPLPEVPPSRSNQRPEVLFLARFHERKRPLTFVSAIESLHLKYPEVHFAMVGPDEGQLPEVMRTIADSNLQDVIRVEPALDPASVIGRMGSADVYVLPSVNEPYPMSVLEAMSLGIPVIITDSCGLAQEVRAAQAGIVVDQSVQGLTEALDKLLGDRELRDEMGSNARVSAAQNHDMGRLADQLLRIYEAAQL